MAEQVIVGLGERSYPVEFKPLAELGATLSALRSPGKCVLVSNSVVGPIYAERALESLRAGGWDPSYLELEDGESKKNAETYLGLVNSLLDLKVTRKTPVIALGGGVTTDIVGFAAATTLRGLPFANVPTTLLAQVDASVGGKTGVNTPQGKNLLGAFWQPFLVHMAVETLASLSGPEYRCGLGEVLKHAVLEEQPDAEGVLQPSSEFMCWLEGAADKLVARDPEALCHTIQRCVEIKASVVSQDEREAGKRALLNLGHTVGHAIEAVVGYGGLRHGEAVAIGTIAEAHLAVLKGKADAALPERIAALTRALGLPTGIEGLDVDRLIDAAFMDKKREQEHISVAVPFAVGDVRLVKLTPEELRPAFEILASNAQGQAGAPAPAAASPPHSPAGVSSSALAGGASQNSERPSTRVHQPPGGASSIIFG